MLKVLLLIQEGEESVAGKNESQRIKLVVYLEA